MLRGMGSSRNGASAAIENPPDLLGHDGRVRTVAQMLTTIQQARYTLEVEATANLLADDKPSPAAGGGGLTVAQHREKLRQGEADLLEKYADLIPDVQKLIERSGGGG